jgi:hypothetical protein
MVGTYFRFCTRLFMPFISVKLERGSGFDWSNIFILFLMPCRPPSGGAVKFWLGRASERCNIGNKASCL